MFSLSSLLASRISHSQDSSFSALIGRIASVSVGVAVFVIILSYSILFGFQHTIEKKLYSIGSHIQLKRYELYNSFNDSPITLRQDFYESCKQHPEVLQVSPYILKAALIKTSEEVHGVLVKGVSPKTDLNFFRENLIQGSIPNFGDASKPYQVLISQKIAESLRLHIGDKFNIYFVQYPPKARKLEVAGIYHTGLDEIDENFVIGNIEMLRSVNQWPDSLVTGVDVSLHHFEKVDEVSDYIYDRMDYEIGMEKITDRFATIFDWLQLLSQNVIIFLSLIVFIACFNVGTCMLIMIIERTPMIGILKSYGATNYLIFKIFLKMGFTICLKGLLWGNILVLSFCFIQYFFKVIPLDQENYYMDAVPIEWSVWVYLYTNALIVSLLLISLALPALRAMLIRPIRSIKFS